MSKARDEQIERYTLNNDGCLIYNKNDGEYCQYQDYRHIEIENEQLEQQNKRMLEGLIWFVKRVRSGEVRSKKTYAKFVELIESATGLSIEEVLLK